MKKATYDVFSIQYARALRNGREYVLDWHDAHDGPAPINYYIWVIRGEGRTIVVDTGFDRQRALTRRREFIRCPTEGLRSIGIDADAVETVILTHLHYDHAGNLDKFPNACFVLQDEEMRFATGRSMRFPLLRAPFELGDVHAIVAHNYSGRVRFVAGSEEIAPGITVHHVPGHTMGLQCVTVETKRGRLCLASDAAHFYANLTTDNPFPIVTNVAAQLESQRFIQSLVEHPDLLIPGHDPLVMQLFPKAAGDELLRELSARPVAASPLSLGWQSR